MINRTEFNRIIFVFILSFNSMLLSQTVKPNDIVGTWIPEDKSILVHIYKANGMYFGKVTNYKNEYISQKDYKNPDDLLKAKAISDNLIINDLLFMDDGIWDEGTIYDPSKGLTYSCKIKMENYDCITVTGYKFLSFLWRKEIWSRKQ